MVVGIEDGVLRQHDAQHGDLHARDQRLEGAGKLRVGEQRFEQPGGELDHLPVDGLAGAGEQRGAMLFEAIAAGRAASGQRPFGRQVAQQLVEPQQGLLELRVAARRAVAAHAAGGTADRASPAPSGTVPSSRPWPVP